MNLSNSLTDSTQWLYRNDYLVQSSIPSKPHFVESVVTYNKTVRHSHSLWLNLLATNNIGRYETLLLDRDKLQAFIWVQSSGNS